jgi:uncharacterized protein YbjT (DUF2867 family)
VDGVSVKRLIDTAKVAALSDPEAIGDVIGVGGPEDLTNRQVAELYARVAGTEAKSRHIPRAVVGVMAKLLERYPMALTNMEDWLRARVR